MNLAALESRALVNPSCAVEVECYIYVYIVHTIIDYIARNIIYDIIQQYIQIRVLLGI